MKVINSRDGPGSLTVTALLALYHLAIKYCHGSINGLYGYMDMLGSEGTQATLPLHGYNYRHWAAITVLLARVGCWLNTNIVDIAITNQQTLTEGQRPRASVEHYGIFTSISKLLNFAD